MTVINSWIGGATGHETEIDYAANWSVDVPGWGLSEINDGCTYYPETGTIIGDEVVLYLNGGRIGACVLASGYGNNTLTINGGTDVLIDDVAVEADTDGLYFFGASTVVVRNCRIQAKWDAVASGQSTLDLIDCVIRAIGPSSVDSGNYACGIIQYFAASKVRAYNCLIEVRNAAQSTRGVDASFGLVELHRTSINVKSASGTVKALIQQNNAVLTTVGCEYDRSKTTGTILDVGRIVTDASGNAHADVKLVKTADATAAVADALLDRPNGVETGKTVRQTMRILGAVLAGKASGARTGTESFTGLDGSTPRVQVTTDAAGNRTNATYSI